MTRSSELLACTLLLATALPAAAELKVVLSRETTGRYESVGITVTDPDFEPGDDPGTVTVTMADGSDRRQTVPLQPAVRPGEWRGRFTPVRTGRHTGTAVLTRSGETELGLVPRINVRWSSRPGFVRLHPTSRRVFRYSEGGAFFPVGVRLDPRDLRPELDWARQLALLRSRGLSYVEVPVPWPAGQPDEAREASLRMVDALLLDGEAAGSPRIQLSLEGPAPLDAAGLSDYETHLRSRVARWAYSPAVAVWLVAGATPDLPAETRLRLVRAVREADPYAHVTAVPGSREGMTGPGAPDLSVETWDWQRPESRPALFRMPDMADGPEPLPGETSWQSLVAGGIGLPLRPYRPGAPDAERLRELSRLASVARTIPFHGAAVRLEGVMAVDAPAAFARYASTVIGWVAPDGQEPLSFSSLPRGRYRVRLWDAASGEAVPGTLLWSDGRTARLPLPAGRAALYVQVEPLPASTARPPQRRSRRYRGRRR